MEESSKKKRGRPRFYDPERVQSMPWAKRTLRGTIETMKSAHAYMVIFNAWEAEGRPTEHWAVGFYIDPQDRYAFHMSILAALGRIQNDADILEWARVIADEKLSTRQAVAFIRQWRAGKLL